jgi:predicted ATPase/DNA-binding SARP family transcriptional activator
MLFRVLGPVEVQTDAGSIVVSGGRSRAVLAALLMAPDAVLSVDRLADALWGDDPPSNVANAVHAAVSRLRRALGPLGGLVVTRPPGYLLRIDRSEIDAERFESGHATARAAVAKDPARAAALLDEALALWRGPAYGEFAETFARGPATRLEELRLTAEEDRAEALLRAGAVDEASARASDLAAAHPLRERPVEIAMRAQVGAHRKPDALATYQRHRRHLAEQLGLDPSPRLRELETRIVRDELVPTGAQHRPLDAHPGPPEAALAPSNVPWRPSPLVGRIDELRQLSEAVKTRRVITLVGPGGVGKTRTALEVAHRLMADGRSVWWVDLVPLAAPRLADAVATAAGVEIHAGSDPVGELCVALAHRCGVLFLDNAEHLVDALAPLIERLVDAAPELTVVVTSRERLALDVESVRALPPLPLPLGADRDNPAVRLFVDRAPGLTCDGVDSDDIALVAEACRRLDGLPLAIELGAARAGALGLPLLLERLGARLDLLSGGRRTADRRHHTLRAVVEWSYDLLTDDEARLFARLAVFPSTFRLPQAEAVCSDDRLPVSAIGPLLARLVEQSLLQAGGGRFSLLETLHGYAEERLDAAGERAALRTRHARDTADELARHSARLWTTEERAAVEALNDLVPDLHAAWDHAVRTDRPLAIRMAGNVHDFAYFRQRLDLLRWGLEVVEWNLDDPDLPRALGTAGAAAWSMGRLAEAAVHAQRGIDLAGGRSAPQSAQAVKVCADLAMFAGRSKEAVSLYRHLAGFWSAAGEPVLGLLLEVAATHALATSSGANDAAAAIDDQLARAIRAGNPTTLSWAYYISGVVAATDDPDRALIAYRAAVDHGVAADSRLFVMLARTAAAVATAQSGETDSALRLFSEILDLWGEVGNQMIQWFAMAQLVVQLATTCPDGTSPYWPAPCTPPATGTPPFRSKRLSSRPPSPTYRPDSVPRWRTQR